jgi:hypothetical protein
MASQVAVGSLTPSSSWGEYNQLWFVIQQLVSRIQTATVVQVQSCTNDGGVSPFGFVNVTPLVNQVDGNGNATPHGIVNGLPYLRIQGGSNAVIIDPQEGDLGIAVFASRDITKVKNTQAQAVPDSLRMFDYADGMYLGGLLNAAPTQYLQFNENGITVLSPTAVAITAPQIQAGASGATLQALMTQIFENYFVTKILPFLTGLGYTGGAPPSGSVTSNLTGS